MNHIGPGRPEGMLIGVVSAPEHPERGAPAMETKFVKFVKPTPGLRPLLVAGGCRAWRQGPARSLRPACTAVQRARRARADPGRPAGPGGVPAAGPGP